MGRILVSKTNDIGSKPVFPVVHLFIIDNTQMSLKKLQTIKLRIPAGKANPAPPIGSSFGQAGLNTMEFCTTFNTQTKIYVPATILPVKVHVYEHQQYRFEIQNPPSVHLIKKCIQNDTISLKALYEIACLVSFETKSIQNIVSNLVGTCRSMKLKIV